MYATQDRATKHVVPILITAVKRLERQQQQSSKRVHFKLRKTQQRQARCCSMEMRTHTCARTHMHVHAHMHKQMPKP